MSINELKDYKIGKTIGSGSFSKVKIATHILSKQKVAIKIIDKKMMAEIETKRIKKNEEQMRLDKIQKQKEQHIENVKLKNENESYSPSSSIDNYDQSLSGLLKILIQQNQKLETVELPPKQIPDSTVDFIGNFEVD